VAAVLFTWSLSAVAHVAPALAQPAEGTRVAADPINCWWRTTTNAVRMGQPFTLVLTCAVLDNDEVRIVPDQAPLEPAALQLPPFELLRGSHAPDQRSGQRRFFQYEYTLRLIDELLLGKDAEIPAIAVKYRVQTRVAAGAELQGRDQTYLLPAQGIRVMSLVPADATDIREAAPATFNDIERRRYVASILRIFGGVLMGLGGLVGVVGLVRVVRRSPSRPRAAVGLMPTRTVLSRASRELAEIQRRRGIEGWTEELASHALAVLRIIAGYLVAGGVSQRPAAAGSDSTDGALRLKGRRWPRRRPDTLVFGSWTAEALEDVARRNAANGDGRRAEIDELATAMRRFSAASYARDGKPVDEELDASLAAGRNILRRLPRFQFWSMFNVNPAGRHVARGQAWTR
jgi:hypothetical protein